MNNQGQMCSLLLTRNDYGVFVSFTSRYMFKSSACLADQSGDEFVFKEYKYRMYPVQEGFRLSRMFLLSANTNSRNDLVG